MFLPRSISRRGEGGGGVEGRGGSRGGCVGDGSGIRFLIDGVFKAFILELRLELVPIFFPSMIF